MYVFRIEQVFHLREKYASGIICVLNFVDVHNLYRADKCMQAVFEDGETVGVAIRWLEATDSSMQLQMANAALIIANMARSGRSC